MGGQTPLEWKTEVTCLGTQDSEEVNDAAVIQFISLIKTTLAAAHYLIRAVTADAKVSTDNIKHSVCDDDSPISAETNKIVLSFSFLIV